MSERVNNFTVEPMGRFDEWMVKSIDPTNPELAARLGQEHIAYSFTLEHVPDLVPRVLPTDQDDTQIVTERLIGLGQVKAADMLVVIDGLQAGIPTSDRLPNKTAKDYRQRLGGYIGTLFEAERLSDHQAATIEDRANVSWLGVPAFDDEQVFVHTDPQKGHFGYSIKAGLRKPKVYDLEQAHFGNPLVDPTWIRTRHPQYARVVDEHLAQKYDSEPTKLESLPHATAFFSDWLLAKGMYDRMHQPRGNAFDNLSSAYGRVMLTHPRLRTVAEKVGQVASNLREHLAA